MGDQFIIENDQRSNDNFNCKISFLSSQPFSLTEQQKQQKVVFFSLHIYIYIYIYDVMNQCPRYFNNIYI